MSSSLKTALDPRPMSKRNRPRNSLIVSKRNRPQNSPDTQASQFFRVRRARRRALPRWLTRFFAASPISAKVRPVGS
jgi:hypothetical protein